MVGKYFIHLFPILIFIAIRTNIFTSVLKILLVIAEMTQQANVLDICSGDLNLVTRTYR